DAVQFGQPKFNPQNVIVAGGRLVLKSRFNGRERSVCLLQTAQRNTERAEKFSPGLFEEIEIAGIVNVVPNGAFGISDAVGVAKDIAGHGASLTRPCRRRETESRNPLPVQESLLLTL